MPSKTAFIFLIASLAAGGGPHEQVFASREIKLKKSNEISVNVLIKSPNLRTCMDLVFSMQFSQRSSCSTGGTLLEKHMTKIIYRNYLIALLLSLSANHVFADKMVKLRIVVRNQDGDPVSGARVGIWHDWSGIGWSTPLGDWSRPADYQLETDQRGLATIAIPAKTEFKQQGAGERAFGRTLKIEVYKTGYTRGDDSVTFSTVSSDIPDQILRNITIEGSEPDQVKEDNMVVNVRAIRGDTQEPIDGAKVRVFLNTPFLRKEFSSGTDRDGNARVITSKYDNFEIVVTKENFLESRKTVVLPKLEKESGPHEIALSRQAGAEVTVMVNDVDSKIPVSEASVIFSGITSMAYHTATTDSGGRATLFVPEIGRFSAKVSQQFYEIATEDVRILQGEEKKTVAISLKAKPKKDDGHDTIHVMVKTKDGDATAPLVGANVSVANLSSATDVNGEANINGGFDDEVDVTVSLQGYASQTKKARIPRITRYSGGTAHVTFVLDKIENVTTPILFVFEIQDGSTSKPINDTSVYLYFDRKVVGAANTNAAGEALIDINDSVDKPLVDLRKGLRAYVYHPDYEEKLTDITSDLLKPSDERRRVSITLYPNFKAFAHALTAIEAKAAALNSDRQKVWSATREARAGEEVANSSVKKAESILPAISAAGAAFVSAKTRCERASALKKNIEDTEKKAAQIERDLAKKLDDAQQLGFLCTSSSDAEKIRAAYNDAIKLAADIGVLEKVAVKDGDELAKLSEEAKGIAPILAEAEKKLLDFDKELAVVDEISAKVKAALAQVGTLGQNLVGRRNALVEELRTLKVTHGVTRSTTRLPDDLKKRLDAVEPILEGKHPDVAMILDGKPELNSLNKIAQGKTSITELKAKADEMVKDFKSSSCTIEVSTKIGDIGALMTSATIELSSSSDLPKKAEDCAKLGTCRPIIDEIRLLLQQGSIDNATAKIAEARTQGCDVVQITNELDYWKAARDAVEVMKKLSEQCKFQEALAWSEKLPPAVKEKNLIRDAIGKLHTGLQAQKDTTSLLERARAAAVAKNVGDTKRLIDEAQKVAQFYPCLVGDVEKLRKEQNSDGSEKKDPGASIWSGTYYHQMMAGETTLTITFSGGTLTATEIWNDRGSSGVNTWTNCKVDGKTAKCDWTGTYNDKEKSAIRKGTISPLVSESYVSGSYYEDEPTITWRVKPHETVLRKGAVWPASWMRKK